MWFEPSIQRREEVIAGCSLEPWLVARVWEFLVFEPWYVLPQCLADCRSRVQIVSAVQHQHWLGYGRESLRLDAVGLEPKDISPRFVIPEGVGFELMINRTCHCVAGLGHVGSMTDSGEEPIAFGSVGGLLH